MPMSKIEELIKEYCLDGVEYKKLDDVTTYERPDKFIVKNTEYNDAFKIPVLTAGKAFILGYTDETENIYLASAEEPVIIFDDFLAVSKWVDFPFKVKSSAMKFIHATDDIDIRYLFYTMQCINYTPTDHARQWISTYSQFEIPVPPLPVQQEIVRILDSFTELQNELQKELEERKKQYQNCLNRVFEDVSEDNWIELGDMARFSYGLTDTAKDSGDTRFIRITDIADNGHLNNLPKYILSSQAAEKYRLHKGDLVMARTGATYGKTLYIDNDEPAVYASFLIKIMLSDRLDSRYYWHFTHSKFYWNQADSLATHGGQPQFNSNALSCIKVPVVSIDEQKKVADKLDVLDRYYCKLLPAEISLRQQQYTYYRDKLLSFPGKEA